MTNLKDSEKRELQSLLSHYPLLQPYYPQFVEQNLTKEILLASNSRFITLVSSDFGMNLGEYGSLLLLHQGKLLTSPTVSKSKPTSKIEPRQPQQMSSTHLTSNSKPRPAPSNSSERSNPQHPVNQQPQSLSQSSTHRQLSKVSSNQQNSISHQPQASQNQVRNHSITNHPSQNANLQQEILSPDRRSSKSQSRASSPNHVPQSVDEVRSTHQHQASNHSADNDEICEIAFEKADIGHGSDREEEKNTNQCWQPNEAEDYHYEEKPNLLMRNDVSRNI